MIAFTMIGMKAWAVLKILFIAWGLIVIWLILLTLVMMWSEHQARNHRKTWLEHYMERFNAPRHHHRDDEEDE